MAFTNSLAAEIWGLRDGLKPARNMNICKLIIEIDAKAVVDLIHFIDIASLNSYSYSALISDFRYLILSFEEAHLCHVHCECNFRTDILSKARNNPLDVFLESSFIVSQLLVDIWGVCYPRLI